MPLEKNLSSHGLLLWEIKRKLGANSMGQGHRIKMSRNDTSNREGVNNQIAGCYFSSDKQIGIRKLQQRR